MDFGFTFGSKGFKKRLRRDTDATLPILAGWLRLVALCLGRMPGKMGVFTITNDYLERDQRVEAIFVITNRLLCLRDGKFDVNVWDYAVEQSHRCGDLVDVRLQRRRSSVRRTLPMCLVSPDTAYLAEQKLDNQKSQAFPSHFT
jgi:hypothetical protein